MSNKTMKFCLLAVLCLNVVPLRAQTDSWRLIWDKNTEPDVYLYRVYRGASPSPTSQIDNVMHPDTFYVDDEIMKGVIYYYRVRAMDYSSNLSDYSVQVSAAIPEISGVSPRRFIPADSLNTILLDPLVNDPDNPDNQLTWSVTGANRLNVTINQTSRSVTIATPSDWSGTETLTFRVTDPDDFFDRAEISVEANPITNGTIAYAIQTSHFGAGTNIEIKWNTLQSTKDYVEYGLEGNYSDQTAEDSKYMTEHAQVLPGLRENSTYSYRIVSEDVNGQISYSANLTFTTGVTSAINVFPIPYRKSERSEIDGIFFANLPERSQISIYNLLGEPVFKSQRVDSFFRWELRNDSGSHVKSGVYLYIIKNQNNEKINSGKIIIIL
ncbi:MAG: gliding motility-associated C-terminal domain-containing protein [Calditrichaceae bacterium]